MRKITITIALFVLSGCLLLAQNQVYRGTTEQKQQLKQILKETEEFITELPDAMKEIRQEDYLKSWTRFAQRMEEIDAYRKFIRSILDEDIKRVKITESQDYSVEEVLLAFPLHHLSSTLDDLFHEFRDLDLLNDFAAFSGRKAKNQWIKQKLNTLQRTTKNLVGQMGEQASSHAGMVKFLYPFATWQMEDYRKQLGYYKEAYDLCDKEKTDLQAEIETLKAAAKAGPKTNPKKTSVRKNK